jgi:hypothetical protein
MRNKQILLSGRAVTTNAANVPADRYSFLHLSDAEPNLGTASANGWVLVYDTSTPGNRLWSKNLITAYDHANSAYASQNTTGSYANAAFLKANSAYESQNVTGTYANNAYLHANSAYGSQNTTGSYANSAFVKANSAYESQNTTGTYANAAFLKANSAYASQNVTGTYANNAYIRANNSLNANVGGIVTGNVTIVGDLVSNTLTTTGSGGNITGANSIYANYIFANNIDLQLLTNTAYAQANAGLLKANSAYDQANSAASYANSAFVKANSAYASQNVTGTYANNAYLHANNAYESQNTTGVYANAAFLKANAAYESQNVTGTYANNAYLHANSAYESQNTTGVYANAVFLKANSAYESQNVTGTYANNAYLHANSAYESQNTTGVYANAAFLKANAAYESQNTTGTYANNAYLHANSAYESQNTTGSYANAAFLKANSAYESQNVTGTYANNAYIHANAANLQANSAYESQNVTGTYANNAYLHANSAFDKANSAYESQNVTGTYANSAYVRANNSLNANVGGLVTGNVTIQGDLSITGNVFALGNTFLVDAGTLVANDTLLLLGQGNFSADLLDIGISSHYNDGTNAHTGLIRDAGTKEWHLFKGYTPEVSGNNNIDINHASFVIDTLNANLHSEYVRVRGIEIGYYANAAFLQANTAYASQNVTGTYANNAYLHANSAYESQNVTGTYANNAYLHANASFDKANAAYASQNVTGTYANNAYLHANSAYESQNVTGTYANNAYLHANSAYGSQNVTGTYANNAYLHANSAYESQNTTGVYANAAFLKANSAYESQNVTGTYANNAYLHANAAFDKANSSYASQNVTGTYANNAYLHANAAFIHANSAYDTVNNLSAIANTTNTTIIAVSDHANAAFLKANAAYESQNVTGTYANNAYLHANSAYESQNVTGTYANSAFLQANSAYESQNITGVYTNTAFTHANAAFLQANSAYDSQNATGVYANAAFLQANSAYESQNVTGTYANNAYIHANSAFAEQNLTYAYANAAFLKTNSAYQHANSAYDSQNTTGVYANAAFTKANAAVFSITPNTSEIWVNTSTSNIQIGLANITSNIGTWGGNEAIPVITVDGHGRIVSVSNTTISVPPGTYIFPNTNQLTSNAISGNVLLGLANVNSNIGYYGGNEAIPVINVDGYGRILSVSNTTISVPPGTYIFPNTNQLTSNASSGNIKIGLAEVALNVGIYGSSISIPTMNIDVYGRVVSVTNSSISIPEGTYITNSNLIIANSTTGNVVLGLANSGVTAGTYGGNGIIPIVTVDQYGRVTVAANTPATVNTLSSIQRVSFTTTAAQTLFSLATSFQPGYCDVYVNGIKLSESDYIANPVGTVQILNPVLLNGDVVDIQTATTYTIDSNSSFSKVTFTANAGQTVFNTSYTVGGVNVYLNGLRLQEYIDFSANTGNTITINSALEANDIVEIEKVSTKYLYLQNEYLATRQTIVVPANGQTTFTITGGYKLNFVDVFLNGIKLNIPADVIANNGSTITVLTPTLEENDIIEVVGIGPEFTPANAIPITGGTVYGSLNVWNNVSVNSAITANTLNVTSANITSNLQVTYNVTANAVNVATVYFNDGTFMSTAASGRGDGITWKIASANVTANLGEGLLVDTTSANVYVTLNASPYTGNTTRILDMTGNFAINNCIVKGNGQKIMGSTDDLVISSNNAGIGLVYSNATHGWRIIENP